MSTMFKKVVLRKAVLKISVKVSARRSGLSHRMFHYTCIFCRRYILKGRNFKNMKKKRRIFQNSRPNTSLKKSQK